MGIRIFFSFFSSILCDIFLKALEILVSRRLSAEFHCLRTLFFFFFFVRNFYVPRFLIQIFSGLFNRFFTLRWSYSQVWKLAVNFLEFFIM